MNKQQLTQSIEAREQEIAGYQTNIENYTRMIAKISGFWCPKTEPYKGLDTQALVVVCTDSVTAEQASNLNFRDKLKQTLLAEKLEQAKAKLVLEVLQDQLKEIQ